jgi:hypothetical protein
MHHTGSQEETPVAEPGEQDVPAQEVPENEQPEEELQECLDHQTSSFERGKPWSISPLRFANVYFSIPYIYL